jgi:hypothetical protein
MIFICKGFTIINGLNTDLKIDKDVFNFDLGKKVWSINKRVS